MNPLVPATLEPSKAPAARLALSDAASTFHRQSVFRALDRRQQLIMACSSQPNASAWLNAWPTFVDDSLGHVEGRIAHQIFLGAKIPILADNAGTPDKTGRAVLRASTGPRTYTHDDLNYLLIDLEIEAGNRTFREPLGFFSHAHAADAASPLPVTAEPAAAASDTVDRRRGDTLSINPRTWVKFIHDVVRTDCASDTLLALHDALSKPLRGLDKVENKKDADYAADIIPGCSFFPCGVGTQGELGARARLTVGRLAAAIATRLNGGHEASGPVTASVLLDIRRRLGVRLMRGQARQILAWANRALPDALSHLVPCSHSRHLAAQQRCSCRPPQGSACVCGVSRC